MSYELDISITAPFEVGDLVADLELEGGGQTRIVLRGGSYRGATARAVRLRLTTGELPSGEANLELTRGERPGEPRGEPVTLHQLFDEGCPIPADGRLVVQLSWGAPCHSEQLPDEPARKRFASWEHFICARYVGLDAASDHARPLEVGGAQARFAHDTLLPVGQSKLTFGQIISLAGDFYAHLDARAAQDFAWAWPAVGGLSGWLAGDYRTTTLSEDPPERVSQLFGVIERDKDEDRGAAGEFATAALDSITQHYPARRYLALASQNYCHFACPRPGGGDSSNEGLRLYRAYHQRALDEAAAAADSIAPERDLLRSLVTDAFGCHFLTDLFASGHMRVPRRLLGERYGIAVGALHMSHAMHAEDNTLGLWCTTRQEQPGHGRTVWLAYGDGMLRKEASAVHLGQVQEAVRRSAAEVFAAFCGVTTPAARRAEVLIARPLAPGEAPDPHDSMPDGSSPPGDARPNGWPLFWFRSDVDETIMHRVGPPDTNEYQQVFSILGGRIQLPQEVFT